MAKVLISIGEDLLQQIDAIAAYEERSRSELIREALRQYFKTLRPAPVVRPGARRSYAEATSGASSYSYNRHLLAATA